MSDDADVTASLDRSSRARGAWLAAGVILVLAAGAAETVELPLESPVDRWEDAHPDGRQLSAEGAAAFRAMKRDERREDLVSLLGALAAGALVVGGWPGLARRCDGAGRAALLAGTVVLGTFHAVASVARQVDAATSGTWTLGDDALTAMAGAHAERLREWRDRVDERDAVILVGAHEHNFLRGIVAWALWPRPTFAAPVPYAVPPGTDPEAIVGPLRETDYARVDGGVRWLVDLAALADGREAALLRVDR